MSETSIVATEPTGIKSPVPHFDYVGLQITTIKLCNSNYLVWAQAVKISLGALRKLKFVTHDPPSKTATGYDDWETDNYMVMSGLWNSMEPSIASNFMFVNTAKEIWDAVKETYPMDTYPMDTDVSRIYSLYEKMFHSRQSGQGIAEYYSTFKCLLDELNQYHPLTTDLEVLKRQREEFYVSIFLAGLDPNLQSIRDHILAGGGGLPSLGNIFARLLRVSQPSHGTSTVKENSAMMIPSVTPQFSKSRGHPSSNRGYGGNLSGSRDNGGRDRGCGRRGCGRTETRYCGHCRGTNHSIEYCWALHGKPAWANQVVSSSHTVCSPPSLSRDCPPSTASVLPWSSSTSDSVTLSRAEFSALVNQAHHKSANVVNFAQSGPQNEEDNWWQH
ncbi:uncharacterized protein LOC132300375 isoform X2 [Cornus florida]|uniref:uncharacterized protein LOC132300375 isoform X2 n=1 Tax=Cornus florida TaxID=4283 RepID=UPI0028970EFC|nr:uncharacterized protein LOC132300375 isoform X2 [Cornus florida]